MAAKMGLIGRRAFLQTGLGLSGIAVTGPGFAKAKGASLRIDTLQIEWQIDPLAVDTQQPRFHWSLKALSPKAKNLVQSAFRLTITEASASRSQIFNSERVQSGKTFFQPPAPLSLKSQTRYVVTLTAYDGSGRATAFTAYFTTGLLAPTDLRAKWIAAEPDGDNRYEAIEGHWHPVDKAQPLPVFQRAFETHEKLVQAHVIVVGLGQYQLFVDGHQISPEGVNGGWTNYKKHVLYDAYDLTAVLAPGAHRVSVELGNGFFNVEAVNGRYSKLSGRFGQPQALVQMRLTYEDGREDWLISDDTWQTAFGGTTYSSIYGGEDFDAARAGAVAASTSDWRPVDVVTGPSGQLVASTFAPMTLKRRLVAVAVHSTATGGPIYDFGLNHSGRPRLRLSHATPGTVITLIPSELLGPDGTPDQASMAGGGVPGLRGIAFTYVCKGGPEEWTPRFTYTGYRYIQVHGANGAKIALESEFLSDELSEAGTFTTSDAKLNAVHSLIRQALLSNSASVLTDCPTREKLGWLEQIYLNAATTMNNLDAVRLYEKMCRDMRDAQEASGMVPAIAPEYIKFLDDKGKDTRFRDSPEWGSALTLATWYAYQRYGDAGILEQNFDAIAKRLQYLETRRNADGLLNFGLGDWYDIGPKNPGYAQLTSLQMTGTATFYAELNVMAQIAHRLGHMDADAYGERANALKRTLLERLFHADSSTFDTGSQTAQAMALVLDLFPDDHRRAALDHLVADLRAHDNHVTAGDIGFHYVVRALSDGGRSDVLYDLLSQPTKPSYLEQIAHGATALTEAWDSWREASQNHFMLGHAEIWFFEGLGGLRIDHSRLSGPVIQLAPQFVEGIARTAVSANTVMGKVSSETSHEARVASVIVSIPAGQRAEVHLPFDPATLRESGRAMSTLEAAEVDLTAKGSVLVRLGSGSYRFTGHLARGSAK